MGRLCPSSVVVLGTVRPDRLSHESCRSSFGVPVGVLLALSTRICLVPERGVMLVLRNADTGDTTSSFSRGTVPLLLRTKSGLGPPRLASGVTTGGF